MGLKKANARQFIKLLDCPTSFAGQSLLYVRVNAGETGLEFTAVAAPAGTVTGPASSTDNALMRWDGAGGTLAQNSAVIVDDSGNMSGVASIVINNTGLKVKDTDASHNLSIIPGSNLSANRNFTITTGDANRNFTLGGDVTFGGAVSVPSALTISAQSLTLTLSGATNVTLPTSGTLASLSNTIADFTAPTADFSMNSHKITNVTDPGSAQDAATKAYVDSIASGLSLRTACKYATTANVTGTYLAGVITALGFGAISVDGFTPSVNDRILLKDQTTAANNGIYVVTTVGDGGTAYVLTRATDNDTSAEMVSGLYAFVTAGTANAAKGFVLTTADPITLDVTALTFTQFSSAGAFTAGNGLTLVGSAFSAVATTGITVTGAGIGVDFTAVQAIDATLTALAALNSTAGFLVQTAADTFTKRTLTVLDGITITDGAGTSNNPAIGVTINTLTADGTPDQALDYVMTYDASAGALKKVLLRDISSGGSTLFRQVGTSPLECWYSPALTQSTVSTLAMAVAAASSTMYAVPFIEGKGGTLDRMAINVNVAVANTLCRFGIYNSTSSTNLYPSTLLVEAGESDTSTVGTKTQTISAGMVKGQLYWFVFICDNTTAVATGPTLRAIAAAAMPSVLGTSSAFGTLPNTHLLIAGQTYGALPGTFPAGATVATGNAPAAVVRYSA